MAEIQEKDIKTTCVKMIEVLKEEMSKSLEEMNETQTVDGNK